MKMMMKMSRTMAVQQVLISSFLMFMEKWKRFLCSRGRLYTSVVIHVWHGIFSFICFNLMLGLLKVHIYKGTDQ